MMFLKRRDFMVHTVFSFAALLGIGAGAYITLRAGGSKFLAERFLFSSLVAGGIFLLLLYRTFSSSRRAMGQMDKIIEMARYGGALAEDRLENFGPAGRKLKTLYRELGELSSRRAERIRLLSSLTEGLLSFVEIPLLVVDAAGKVLYSGEAYRIKISSDSSGAAGKSVAEVLPDLSFKKILSETDRVRGPVEAESNKTKVTFYPLYDHANNTAAYIAAFGPPPAFALPGGWEKRTKEKGTEIPGEKRGLLQFLQKRLKWK